MLRRLLGKPALYLLSGGLIAVPALLVALHAYRAERRAFTSRRHAPRLTLHEFGIRDLVEVSFKSRGGTRLRGYYAPPRADVTVILAHGSAGERSDLVEEARILAAAGIGVLAFDWPGHGESEGRVTWDEVERQALRGAVDWLVEQPGVDPARLGAYGFSMGGYLLLQVAVTDPRLRAVALAGAPHDALEHTRWEYRRGSVLRQWPALLAARRSGMRFQELVPERIVASLSPRSLLLVAGSEDRDVPLWMTERLLRAAREPKRLLVVRGAKHGGYHQAGGETYAKSLRDFFLALSGAPPSSCVT